MAVLLMTMLLIFSAGCERKVVYEGDDQSSLGDCFTCHGEEGYLLAAKGEWENSIHASGNNVDYTNRGGFYDCTTCHDHQGFVDFLEAGEINAPYDRVSSIHCFTCHAPHTRGDLSLRTNDPYTLFNGDVFDHGSANLCANCHHSRLSADDVTEGIEVSAYWGPHHGPQGDLINKSNGYEFDGYEYGNTGHSGVGDGNACIGCHMGNPQTHVGYRIGGHSFNMIDEESDATLVGICQGCHPDAEDYDYDGIQTEVASLLHDLETLLFEADIIDDDAHPLEIAIDDEGAAGALYNFLLVEEDRSYGVHNPEYIVDLLESSIAYMEGLAGKKIVSGRKNSLAFEPVPSH